MSETGIALRIHQENPTPTPDTPYMPSLVDKRVIRPAQTALALDLVNKMDLLRLKTIARVYARGLEPEVAWEDMLQEALTRVLVGSRLRPEGVTMVTFVAGILRSLRADYWRLAARASANNDTVRIDYESDETVLRRCAFGLWLRQLTGREERELGFSELLLCEQASGPIHFGGIDENPAGSSFPHHGGIRDDTGIDALRQQLIGQDAGRGNIGKADQQAPSGVGHGSGSSAD